MFDPASVIETALRQISAADITNGVLAVLLAIFLLGAILAARGKCFGLVHYTPNLLTSLGILGTFAGIVIGLLGFNVNNIDGSIGALLEGLKTAFITSLGGMSLAILFKTLDSSGWLKSRDKNEVVEHIGPEEIHAELQAQREAMERLSWAIAGDEDSALVSQIRLLRSDAQDQSKSSLEQLRAQSELQASLSRNIELQQQTFEAFIGELWKKLDDFAEVLSKSATEQVINALKEVITDFNRNLTEQFGENFKQLNAAVEELVQWQENYRVQLTQMNEQYAQGVQAITQTASSVAEIGEQSRQIPQTMGELKTVMETAHHQIQELERHLEAFRDMRDRAVEAVPQIRQQMDQMAQDVSAAVKDAGEQIMTASQVTHNAIIEGAKDFENRVNRTNEGLTTASDQLANNSERIREQLDATVKDINGSVRSMVAEVMDSSKTIGNNLVEANRQLGTSIKEVQYQVTDSIESMQKRLESSLEQVFQATRQQMGQMVQDMSAAVKDAGEQIMTASQVTHNAIIEGATSASDQLASNSERVREQLAATVTDINASVRSMIAEVADSSKAIGNNLVDANKQLGASIKEVQHQVTDSIESMQKRLESSLEQVFQAQTREIARTFGALEEELRKSVSTTGEAMDKQLKAVDEAMLTEIERVMQEMGSHLAGITQRFTKDYSKLTSQMGKVIEHNRQFARTTG